MAPALASMLTIENEPDRLLARFRLISRPPGSGQPRPGPGFSRKCLRRGPILSLRLRR